MKKALFIALFSLFIISAYSQVPSFTLGPKVGFTVSKYNADFADLKSEALNTLHWGAFVRLGNKLYIQPELLYMNRSGVLIDPSQPASEQIIRMKSMDVPLLIGAKIINLELINVRLFAGPVASFAINRDVEFKNWDKTLPHTFDNDDLKGANWAVQFGGGVDLLMFTVDLRYEMGMSDVSKLSLGELSSNVFTASIGWKIL